MAYDVILADMAEFSLDVLLNCIVDPHSSENGRKAGAELMEDLQALLGELHSHPHVHPASMSSKDGREYRQGFICQFRYRVIYAIDEPTNTVVVSRVMSSRELLEDYEYEL